MAWCYPLCLTLLIILIPGAGHRTPDAVHFHGRGETELAGPGAQLRAAQRAGSALNLPRLLSRLDQPGGGGPLLPGVGLWGHTGRISAPS